MIPHRPAVLSLVLLLQGTATQPRDAVDWVRLAERCFGGGEAAKEGLAELRRQVERDYPGAFAAWQAAKEDRIQELLDSVLGLPAVRAATVVLRGRVQGVAAHQGGVIDHHDLVVTFAGLEVLRAGGPLPVDRRAGTVCTLRGTSQDAWLADQLRQNLERVPGERVWLFTLAELRRPARGGGEGLGLTMLEWSTLPAAAWPCVQQVR